MMDQTLLIWLAAIGFAVIAPIALTIRRQWLLFIFLASLGLWNARFSVGGLNIKLFQAMFPFVVIRFLPLMIAHFIKRFNIADFFMLILTAILCLSYFYTVDFTGRRTLHVIAVVLPLIFIYYLLRYGWRSRKEWRLMINSLLFGAILVIAYGFGQLALMLFGVEMDLYVYGRVQATFNEPNWLGNYICFILPLFGLCHLYNIRTLLPRAWLLVFNVSVALQLLLSYTRGAWVALTCSLLVFGAIERRYWGRIVKMLAIGVLVLGALLALDNYLPGKVRLGSRILNLASTEYGTSGGHRMGLYRETLYLSLARDDILYRGYGLGTWGLVYTQWNPEHELFEQKGVENAYADLLFSTGLPGLLMFLITFGYPILRFLAVRKRLQHISLTRYRLALALFLSLIAQLLAIFISNALTFPFLWVNLALLVNHLSQLDENDNPNNPLS